MSIGSSTSAREATRRCPRISAARPGARESRDTPPEQVAHDGVARAPGPRRRSDERNRPGIGEDLDGSARHGRRLSFDRWPTASASPASQINSSPSKSDNLERMERLVARAAATGADLVLLPEKWNGLGSHEILLDVAEPLEGGETVEAMSSWARTHGITLVGGSIAERRDGREKLSNTCVVFDPEGEIAAVYRKIHMFDVEVGGVVYRESDSEEPGDGPVSCEVEGWRLGLTVCYDLRFPELYRILAVEGAELRHRSGRVHALHRQGPLGAAPPRPGGREPVLRRRREPVGRRRGQGVLRPQLDRRPVGRRARAGARRGRRHLSRARPRAPGADPQQPALARQPPARRLHVAGGGLGPERAVEAVLFDVDFTLAKPGPLLGPEGYRAAGERHGLTLDPGALRRGPGGGRRGSRAPSRARARRGDLGPLHGGHRARHGRRGRRGSARSPRRSPRAGSTRRTSSCTRTCSRCSPSCGERGLRIGLVSNTSRDLTAFVAPLRARRRRLDLLGRPRQGEAEPDDLPRRARAARRRAGGGRDGRATRCSTTSRGPGRSGCGPILIDREGRFPDRDDALPTLLALPALLASAES